MEEKKNFYLKVIDGQPVDNPYMESNLIQYYGAGNIPEEFKPFKRRTIKESGITSIRIDQKTVNRYELSDDGVTWEDVWVVMDLTPEELEEKKRILMESPPGPNLTLDDKLRWTTNIPRPDGKYRWDYPTGQWVPFGPPPENP